MADATKKSTAAKKAPAAKKTATARTSANSGGSGPTLRERLGWRAERRPEPGFAHVLGAGAGAFAVLAMASFVVAIGSDDLTVPGVLLSLALAVTAFVLGARLPGPIRSASVTALLFTIPLVWGFALFGDGGPSHGGGSNVRLLYLASALVYVLLYFVTWTRGRAVLLGVALFAAVSCFVIGAEGRDSTVVPFQGTVETQVNPFGEFDSSPVNSGDTTAAAVVALVLGGGLLAGAFLLDRRGLRGAATPLIVVGAIFTLGGGISLGAEESQVVGGLIAAAAGAVVGLVGGFGRDRRGSTWIGVIAVVLGLAAVIDDIYSSNLAFAGLAALVALALGAAAFLLAPRLHEAVEGDDASG